MCHLFAVEFVQTIDEKTHPILFTNILVDVQLIKRHTHIAILDS
jgi:hypothetical protein